MRAKYSTAPAIYGLARAKSLAVVLVLLLSLLGSACAEAEAPEASIDVVLISDGAMKIAVIKEVRALTGLGLKDAKDLVESAPVVILESASEEDAEQARVALEEAGAQVELR